MDLAEEKKNLYYCKELMTLQEEKITEIERMLDEYKLLKKYVYGELRKQYKEKVKNAD